MNNIRKTIGYADYSWNPITGCLRGCEYCYARRIAERFTPRDEQAVINIQDQFWVAHSGHAFPFGWELTYYPHRLAEPRKLKQPSRIFVADMADLWGSWVPEWIQWLVERATLDAPWHIYLFLTKSPAYYPRGMEPNWWAGATVEHAGLLKRVEDLRRVEGHRWLSIEPILGPIPEEALQGIEWVVVGAQTGPGAQRPQREWVQDLYGACHRWDIPIYMKGNLRRLWPGELVQEVPW